jgi:hypothetical protein
MDHAGNIIPISQSTKLYFGPTYVCPGPSSDSLTHWFFKAFGLQTRPIQDLTYVANIMKNHENLGMPLEVLWGTSVYRFLWIKYIKLERYERFVHPWLD